MTAGTAPTPGTNASNIHSTGRQTSIDTGRLPGMEVRGPLGGRYELIDEVGRGGMAVVWRARDTVLGRTVAVKLLSGPHAGDPESRHRIRDEARAAAGLSHPNIAQVYDYGESDDGMPYIVMELIRGQTLQERQAGGPLAPAYAMRVGAEVAAALAAAHADGLAHRDIKPANIMLTPAGAKVVDFGIAAAIRAACSEDADFEVLGTPAYLAPERLTDDAVEPASDVYALGVLLYRLLANDSPWSADTTTQMLTAHIYIEPVPLPPLPGVPDYVTGLCNRCLSKDPTLRPTARDAAGLLAHAAGLRVVEDEPVSTGSAVDREPSVLIRSALGPDAAHGGPASGSPAVPQPVTGAQPIAWREASVKNPAGPRAAASAQPAIRPVRPEAPASEPAAPQPGAGAQPGVGAQPVVRPVWPETPASERAAPRPAASAQPVAGPARSESPASEPGAPHVAARAQPIARPARPETPASDSAAPLPATTAAGLRNRRVAMVGGAAALVAAALLWLFIPDGRDAATPPPNAAISAAPSQGASARDASSKPASPGATATAGNATRGPAGPAAGRTAEPDDPAGAPTTTPGGRNPTTASPTPEPTATTTAAAPQERTLTSTGGSVVATCPSATTAELRSWSATKPYKVNDVNAGPATAAVVTFKHGNRRVMMTVTCTAGTPSTTNTES